MLALATPARHSRARLRWATPIAALVAVSVISLAARVAFLGSPCHEPCTSASAHVLVFDESYYVNAARVIAGVGPPPGAHYRDAPAGDDPNAEHPQLAKVVIAGAIELFGDGPLAWRLPSILLGSLAILGMFALVRSAGGGPWVAVGAAALMAADNLLLVHSRIATLDIYAVTAMIWAAVLYLRGRPLLAGAVIGVGACAKEVAPYVLLGNIAPSLQSRVLDQIAKPRFVVADTMDLWITVARQDLEHLLKRIDMVVLNDSEAKLLTDNTNLIKAAHMIRKMGPRYVCIKKGEHGALLFGDQGAGEFFSCPSFPVGNLVDPTGAGDCFAGGLAGHLARGEQPVVKFAELRQAVVYGSVLASYAVE